MSESNVLLAMAVGLGGAAVLLMVWYGLVARGFTLQGRSHYRADE